MMATGIIKLTGKELDDETDLDYIGQKQINDAARQAGFDGRNFGCYVEIEEIGRTRSERELLV